MRHVTYESFTPHMNESHHTYVLVTPLGIVRGLLHLCKRPNGNCESVISHMNESCCTGMRFAAHEKNCRDTGLFRVYLKGDGQDHESMYTHKNTHTLSHIPAGRGYWHEAKTMTQQNLPRAKYASIPRRSARSHVPVCVCACVCVCVRERERERDSS